MKYLNLVIALIIFQACCASAQDTAIMARAMRQHLIIMQAAKYIELNEVPRHIGDTICVYGHVHDVKAIPGITGFIVNVDSASSGKLVAVEINYLYEWAKQSTLGELKKHNITVWGVAGGSREKPIIKSSGFIPDDESASDLSSFKSMIQRQKDTTRKTPVRVVSVELRPLNKEERKDSDDKYFSEKINKKIWYCDNVSDVKSYTGEMLTELYLDDGALIVVIKGKVLNKFGANFKDKFLKKQICIRGVVIPYKGKFAVNVTNSKQIELTGY